MIVSTIWGLSAVAVLSYVISRTEKTNAWKVVLEHLVIALVVVTATHFLGDWISLTFR